MKILLTVLIASIAFLAVIFFPKYLLYISGLLLFGWYAISPDLKKLAILTIAVTALISQGLSEYVLSIRLLGFNIHIIEIMIVVIWAGCFIAALRVKEQINEFPKEYYFMIVFYFIVFISIFRGADYSISHSFSASRELFYYSVAFIAFIKIKKMEDAKFVLNAFYLGIILYSIELISVYIWKGNPLREFINQQGIWGAGRISFRNHQLLLISLSVSFAMFGLKKYSNRFLNMAIFFISLIFITLGESRILLLCAITSIIAVFVLSLIKRNSNIDVSKYFILFAVILSITVSSLTLLFYGDAGTKGIPYELKQRISSVNKLNLDSSYKFREQQWFREINKIRNYLWFGQGTKAFYNEFDQDNFENIYWDNTNTLFIRKVGLLGYIFILLFCFCIFYKLIYIYVTSRDPYILAITIGLLSIIPGFVIRLFTSPFMIQHKGIVIYAILMGLVQRVYLITKYGKIS